MGSDEWYTMPKYLESARRVMGNIDLDPASKFIAQTVVKADRYITEEMNGLKSVWTGRVYLNPPFSHDKIAPFVKKLIGDVSFGETTQAVLLVNNYTETDWFQLLLRETQAVCFVDGRMRFWNLEHPLGLGTGTRGQAFFYFGTRLAKFTAEFSQYGVLLKTGVPSYRERIAEFDEEPAQQ